jgi:hypothetical protein
MNEEIGKLGNDLFIISVEGSKEIQSKFLTNPLLPEVHELESIIIQIMKRI